MGLLLWLVIFLILIFLDRYIVMGRVENRRRSRRRRKAAMARR